MTQPHRPKGKPAGWSQVRGRDGAGRGGEGQSYKPRAAPTLDAGTDGEGEVRFRAWSQTGSWEDLVTEEEGAFGVQNQPSEARVSKLKHINKQAGRGCACELRAVVETQGIKAKATRGDNAVRSSSSPSAGAPAPLRTSSPASGTFPSSYDRRDPSACPEWGTLWRTWSRTPGAEEGVNHLWVPQIYALVASNVCTIQQECKDCTTIKHVMCPVMFYRCMLCQFFSLHKSLHKAALSGGNLVKFSRKEEETCCLFF